MKVINLAILFKGLVMCAGAVGDSEARQQFWHHVLDPAISAFKNLITSQTFPKQYQEEQVKKQILYHLDNFIGMIILALVQLYK